jgi:branched-chain amino acid transport system ATP-binding protein
MLKVSNLWIQYGYVEAVRGISFEVKDNEIVALIGANGAGKSSTLLAISGIIEKEAGRVYFNDQDITDANSKDIVKLGISHIPEGRHVLPDMTVEENLFMGTYGSPIRMTKEQIGHKKQEMYELFPRLAERKKQTGGTLSGGEQQMLAIARGLMSNPKLIIFDEPSLGLAPILLEEVYKRIDALKKTGVTMLLVEQNACMALEIVDRAYVMETGSIVMEGCGQDLLNNAQVKKAYLGM